MLIGWEERLESGLLEGCKDGWNEGVVFTGCRDGIDDG